MATTDKSALDEALDQVEHADERTVRVALDLIRSLQCAGLSEQAVGEVLEQRYADQRWSEHIGPFLRSRDVARLLGLTRQAVAKRRDLLAIRTGRGQLAYPVWQFHGRRPVDGFAELMRLLDGVAKRTTLASWFVSPHPDLDARAPIDALRHGERAAVRHVAQAFHDAFTA
jgi:hypothetical protein